MKESTLQLVRQNWTKYLSCDLDFLEKLDKKQILLLFKQYKNKCTTSECYHCFNISGRKIYGNLPICKQCIKGKNYINIKCNRLEKNVLNLKKHIIGINEKGLYSCIYYGNIESTNTFPMRVKNQQWYNHCFGVGISIKCNYNINNFIFNLYNKSHRKLFMQCTRFNHYNNFIGFRYRTCYAKNYIFHYRLINENESSVEKIMLLIDTARLVFRQFRVPKCIRNLIIEWFLV